MSAYWPFRSALPRSCPCSILSSDECSPASSMMITGALCLGGHMASVQFFLQPLSKGLMKLPSGALRYRYRCQFASSLVVTLRAICTQTPSTSDALPVCAGIVRQP